MTDLMVLDIIKQALIVGVKVSGPLLLSSLLIGMLVGLLMAATQIQEFTLTFVPKLIAMGVVILLVGPWMLQSMKEFALQLFGRLTGVAP